MMKKNNFKIIIGCVFIVALFMTILISRMNFSQQYKLISTIEYGPNENIEEYINYYFNRFILDENYQQENNIELLKDEKYVVDDYNVWEITVKFDNNTGFNCYTYVYFYNSSNEFHRLMFKYDENNNKVKNMIKDKINNLDFEETPTETQEYYPILPDSWSSETAQLYNELQNSDEVLWGIFTQDIKNNGIKYEVPAIEEKIDYKFDIVLAYFHLNEEFPLDFMNYAYEQDKLVELTLQTTVTNNTDLYGKSPLLEIYKGNYDEEIRQIARMVKEFEHPFLFRLNNEMNSDWTSYSGVVNLSDPDIYIECWRKIYKIFEEEGVNNAIWIFNPNDENYPPASWNDFTRYYPGNEYVHMIGLTGYNTGTYYDDLSQRWRSFDEIYNTISNNYHMFNEFPWIITEFSSSSIGGDKVKWIEDMFNTINNYKNIKAAVWFSYADYDENSIVSRPYWLDENEQTTEAFKKGLENSKLNCTPCQGHNKKD